jgi:leucyl aminopeptidase
MGTSSLPHLAALDMLDKLVVFIGCGITSDSGGLCVKTPHEME